ncbi:MAG TPA: hypothetical protein VEQ10_09700 [Vicinamibacteria bacterium]|nr:hypothetical protein [Vicinamibacteria bacterium]
MNDFSSSNLLGGADRGPGERRRAPHHTEYLEAPLRHPWLVALPLLLCIAAATAAAFLLPERFTASCLVLIKASQVPDKIIPDVSEEMSARRHQTIRQEILSRTRLEKVDAELHPYPTLGSVSAAVDAMQAAIDVAFKGTDAFSVQYTHRDPHMAMAVTNRVAALFIDEFRRSRQTQYEGATEFLDSELREARKALDAKEEALRLYKERNLGRLPEQLEATLSTLQRLQFEAQSLEQNLQAAEARLERLDSRSTVEASVPATPSTPSERETLELELARLRQRYTEEHPDVRELREKLRRLAAPPPPSEERSTATSAQQERARAEVETLLTRREGLRAQIVSLQARVEQMPRTEQELATLTRDFNQLKENYQTVLKRKMDAQMAERLQQRWTEDFEILDLARLPERHTFPNRPLFIAGGVVLGLALGLAAALTAVMLTPNLTGLEDLESVVAAPVLAVLPEVDAKEAAAASRALTGWRAPRARRQPAPLVR